MNKYLKIDISKTVRDNDMKLSPKYQVFLALQ